MELQQRRLSRRVWRQIGPRWGLLEFPDPARTDGRYHRRGEDGVWYASFTERGAWAELFRHWDTDEVSPLEVRRRVGRARLEDLNVLDLTDPLVREKVGVTIDELVNDDTTRCQDLAHHARAAGLDGVMAPSGALEGETTVVVFAHAMNKVAAEHSRVQRPPTRMLKVLTAIRLPDAAIDGIGRLYDQLTRH